MSQELVTIASGPLSASVSPSGAELQRFTHAGFGELLWDGDASVWKGRAPLLFPIVGALVENRYRVGKRVYTLPRHGFARTSRWSCIAHEPTSVTFEFAASDETRAVYPFVFRLAMTYALDKSSLRMRALLRNEGAGAMPASFGFHPAFRRPLPYGAPYGDHVVAFAEAEPAPIRLLTPQGVLRRTPEPTPVRGRTLALADRLFDRDALIFDALRSRALIYGVPGGRGLAFAFGDMPQLGIWAKPHAGFLCIEPWAGYADPEGFTGEIFEKPGIVALAAGESRVFEMTISLVDVM